MMIYTADGLPHAAPPSAGGAHVEWKIVSQAKLPMEIASQAKLPMTIRFSS